ncbi:MAG: hypothetical protein J5855_06365 [Mailhella sp.]|nr:hypothetical protein [Mailhella sp.]
MPDDNKIWYQGHRQRLKHKLREDPASLSDAEILEMLLGYAYLRRDTKPMAGSLLGEYKSLGGVLNSSFLGVSDKADDLPAASGILILVREIVSRYFTEGLRTKNAVTYEDLCMLARSCLDGGSREQAYAAFLDAGNRLLSCERISSGIGDSTGMPSRKLAELVLKHNAVSVVLMHNHPGGTAGVSKEDIESTKRIGEILEMMDARLIDHLLVADGVVYSFAANGLL